MITISILPTVYSTTVYQKQSFTGLDYELLAGIVTARISNYLNAVENYWGSPDINVVRSKVFDFDDWNSYAIAHFTPYKLEASFDASMSSSVEREKDIDFDNLGGRLTQSMQLINRGRPYVIKSDLTVCYHLITSFNMFNLTIIFSNNQILKFSNLPPGDARCNIDD